MTSNHGILSSYFNLSNNHNIVVDNGNLIPVHGCGRTTFFPPNPPLNLNDVLHAPKLIKNLVYVRKFTSDNMVPVEFDPF